MSIVIIGSALLGEARFPRQSQGCLDSDLRGHRGNWLQGGGSDVLHPCSPQWPWLAGTWFSLG